MPEGSSKWVKGAIEKGATSATKTFANASIEGMATHGQYVDGYTSVLADGASGFGEKALESIPVFGTIVGSDSYQNIGKVMKAATGMDILPDAGTISETAVSAVGDLLMPTAHAEGVEETTTPSFYQTVFDQNNPKKS